MRNGLKKSPKALQFTSQRHNQARKKKKKEKLSPSLEIAEMEREE